MTAHRQYVLSDNKLASVEETLLYPFTRKENYLDDRGYVYDSIDNHKVFEILRALDKMENYAVDWTATIYEGDADAVVTYNPTTWPTLAQQANASPKAAVANAFWNGRITRYVLFMASDDTRCVVTATADGDMLKVTRVYTPRK